MDSQVEDTDFTKIQKVVNKYLQGIIDRGVELEIKKYKECNS